MLATFVLRVVASDDQRAELAGRLEAVENGATAIFRDEAELLTLLRRHPDEWGDT